MRLFLMIKNGKKRYLYMKDELVNGFDKRPMYPDHLMLKTFFRIEYRVFSTRLDSDDEHSIIKDELSNLVAELREGEYYSYDEMIAPLLREAKLKEIL